MSAVNQLAPITVIIPSYMRKESLLNVISDLAKQSLKPKQVFIIDASPDNLQINKADVSAGINLNFLKFGFTPNASKQRNLAIREVRTPWILFLDDDVSFDADLIEIYTRLAESLGVDGISGLVKLPKYEKYYSVKKTGDRLRNVRGVNYQGADKIIDTHVICTANFFVRTEAVKAVGGFDEQILGTIDDVDFALRLRKKGFRIIHHPLPEVLHFQKSSGARSFGNQWALANLFYFQYRHFEDPKKKSLLINTLWHFCRPSRDWSSPVLVVDRAKNIINAHHEAIQRIQQGPKNLCIRENECTSHF